MPTLQNTSARAIGLPARQGPGGKRQEVQFIGPNQAVPVDAWYLAELRKEGKEGSGLTGLFTRKILIASGGKDEMQAMLKRNFRKVANVKPPASRSDSSEKFVVAQGFRGRERGAVEEDGPSEE